MRQTTNSDSRQLLNTERNDAAGSEWRDDARVNAALEQYLALRVAGKTPRREEFLADHAEIADVLAACLKGLDLVHEIAPQLRDAAGDDTILPPGSSGTQRTLGDYRILREIGRGGMGVVYEAEQISLHRRVALKVLPFAAVLDSRRIRRFKTEAMAAAQLKHPNIVSVYGVGCERSVHFYAMEYVEGQTLAEVIHNLRSSEGLDGKEREETRSELAEQLTSGVRAEQPRSEREAPTAESVAAPYAPTPASQTKSTPQAFLSTERSTQKSPTYFRTVARLGVQVAEALDHAHEEGVVHRDIKPSNLILDQRGKVWVTDFGLARVEADPGLTMTGDIVGTLRYMSPEQALAKRVVVDQRADIYSLCATLYELLTLRPVFEGADRQELIRNIAFEEPRRPRKLNRTVPAELETIVLKGLEKHPEHRYDSAQQLADDLQRYLDDQPIRATPPSLLTKAAKWSRRHKPLVASAIVILLLTTIGLAISSLLLAQQRDAKQLALLDLQHALTEKEEAVQRAEGNLQLAMQAAEDAFLTSIEERLLGHTVDDGFVVFGVFGKAASVGPKPKLSQQDRELIQRWLTFYDRIAQQNRSSPEALLESGKAFSRVALLHAGLDESDEAEQAFEKAISQLRGLTEQFPSRTEYFLELGNAYYQHGRLSRWWPQASDTFDEAALVLSRAIELAPQNVEAHKLRARALDVLHVRRFAMTVSC